MLTEPTREKLLELRLTAFAAAWEQQQHEPEVSIGAEGRKSPVAQSFGYHTA